MTNLAEAARATIPFSALDVKVSGIVRHPDTRTADLTLLLKSKGLDWESIDDGRSTTDITLAAASMATDESILASKVQKLYLTTSTQDPAQLAELVTRLQLTIRVPHKTQSIRVVAETANGGRIGAADLDRKAIDAAPAAPTPEPQLISHPSNAPLP
jgi:hypothetical protein